MRAAERKGLRRQLELYLRYRHLLTTICVNKPAPDPISMWETNTFAASFHARLNVALRHVIRRHSRLASPEIADKGRICGSPALTLRGATFSICHKFRSTVAGFWFSASSVPSRPRPTVTI